MRKSTRLQNKKSDQSNKYVEFSENEQSDCSSSKSDSPNNLSSDQSYAQSNVYYDSESMEFSSDSEYKAKSKNKTKKKKPEPEPLEESDIFEAPETPQIMSLIAVETINNEKRILVKFKKLSYYHCKWLTEKEILADGNSHHKSRLKTLYETEKNFAEHQNHESHTISRNYLFDPLFLMVDRVIHHRINIIEYNGDESESEQNKPDQNTSSKKSDFYSVKNDPLNLCREKNAENSIDENKNENLAEKIDKKKIFIFRIEMRGEDVVKAVLTKGLSPLLKKYIETSTFNPSKKYEIFLQYLVKWKSMLVENCTWENPLNIFGEKNESEGENSQDDINDKQEHDILKYTNRKGIGRFLNPEKMNFHLAIQGRKYELFSDLSLKMKRIGLKNLPRKWEDKRSLRSKRSSTLNGGLKFEDWKPPVYKNGNKLKKPYQEDGVRWLIYNWHMKRNCILADEMGLGKTIQTIALAQYLFKEQKLRGPFIIIAPKTTLMNWQREFESWTDLNVLTFDGTKNSRNIIKNYDFYFDDEKNEGKTINHLTKFDVILISYGLVLIENIMSKFEYGLLVVDEAHRLKNPESKLYQIIQTEYTFHHCVFLTGTPLQNEISELWSLLSLLEPKIFYSCENFEKRYGTKDCSAEDSAAKISDLHSKVLKPFMLRRVKDDVALDLDPAKEVIIWLRLTREQKKYFKAIYEQNTDFLYAEGRKSAPSLMNIHMQLRHCCNHPFVLRGVEDRTRRERGLKTEEEIMQTLVNVSCKMDFLDKFLPMMRSQGHKVLIFSQFKLILDIIEDYLNWKRFSFERIDGEVDLDTRQNSIDRYNMDPDNFIFLISTRAGGLGINLTSADTVIIYDSDWNPQNDLQAQARAHRIGQKRQVTIYRLVTKNSYEEIMFQKAGKKLGLEKALLHSWIKSGREKDKGKSGNLNKEELDQLLKYGAYYVLKDKEEDNKPQSIEDILANSEVLKRKVEQKETILGQATFKTNIDDNLDLNDPDFWRKIGLPKKRKNENAYGKHKRIRSRPVDFWANKENVDIATSSESEESDESFDVQDEGEWSRFDRDAFDRALINYGFGRWNKIILDCKLKKSPTECTKFAFGLLRIYTKNGWRCPNQMLNKLHKDLMDIIKKQEEDENLFEKDKSGDKQKKGAKISSMSECVDDLGNKFFNLKDVFDKIEQKRMLFLKKPFELLEMINLDPSLESEKWYKKRFPPKFNISDAKALESMWIINSIKKIGWKSMTNPNGIEFPKEIDEIKLPEDWWKEQHDKNLFDCIYENGFIKGFKIFIKTDLPTVPSESKLRKRILSVIYRAKLNLLKHIKASKFESLKKTSQLNNKKNSINISRAEVELLGIKPPKKKRITKAQLASFRRFVQSWPVRNPRDLFSWKFLADLPEKTLAGMAGDVEILKKLNFNELHGLYLKFEREMRSILDMKTPEGKSAVVDKNEPKTSFEMTVNSAKRFKKRLKLFENIFKCLELKDLKKRAKKVKPFRIPLPRWKIPDSDIDLMNGIVKHGFGNWQKMKFDDSFKNLFSGKADGYPKESKIVARLELVTDQILHSDFGLVRKVKKKLTKNKLNYIKPPPLQIINLIEPNQNFIKEIKLNSSKSKNNKANKENKKLQNIKTKQLKMKSFLEKIPPPPKMPKQLLKKSKLSENSATKPIVIE